ncbi:MAG: uncharacterized protein A8A55_2783 [Amphiamblys sp. WSBS2006]|nr:MAG: uncharacterized protein A8A55_2783 [Amphiamblys sp. WSBS2006]
MWSGKKLKKITVMGGGHMFYFGKGDDSDEGVEVYFLFTRIKEESKSHMENCELDLGKIKSLGLIKNAVELLPMLKIHSDNRMDLLHLSCDSLPELGDLLKRKNRVFIGSVVMP